MNQLNRGLHSVNLNNGTKHRSVVSRKSSNTLSPNAAPQLLATRSNAAIQNCGGSGCQQSSCSCCNDLFFELLDGYDRCLDSVHPDISALAGFVDTPSHLTTATRLFSIVELSGSAWPGAIKIVPNTIANNPLVTATNFGDQIGLYTTTVLPGQLVTLPGSIVVLANLNPLYVPNLVAPLVTVDESVYNGYYRVVSTPGTVNPAFVLAPYSVNEFCINDAITIHTGPSAGLYLIDFVDYTNCTFTVVPTGYSDLRWFISMHMRQC